MPTCITVSWGKIPKRYNLCFQQAYRRLWLKINKMMFQWGWEEDKVITQSGMASHGTKKWAPTSLGLLLGALESQAWPLLTLGGALDTEVLPRLTGRSFSHSSHWSPASDHGHCRRGETCPPARPWVASAVSQGWPRFLVSWASRLHTCFVPR